jgi:hypothetical protein
MDMLRRDIRYALGDESCNLMAEGRRIMIALREE